jgi:predicted permease
MSNRQDDYDEEIREHIEIETGENIARGMPPDEARRAAFRAFGNPAVVRQRLREGGPLYWLEELLQDIQYGWRLLRQNPLLSCSIVLTLTLGIGINTGVFNVLNGIMLRARVEKDPDTFAHVAVQYSGEVGPTVLDWGVSTADFRAYQARIQTLDSLAAWGIARSTIGADDPTQWLIMPVTCNFFSLYGLERPKLGRLFRPEDCEKPGSEAVVVLSEELWRNRFQADPQVLGTRVTLNRHSFTVVGVTPGRFSGQLRGPGLWVPYTMESVFYSGRDLFHNDSIPWLTLEGRLKPGQTRSRAQAELATIARQQERLLPGRKATVYVTNGSFVQEPAQRVQMLWIGPLIMGVLTLVLLLACTNVTMLLLSRAAARQREIAIRLSLGAGRNRLLRMLLTESLILACVSGAISAWIATRVPGAMSKLIPGMPYYPLEPNMLVFAYLACITLIAGTIAGLTPAVESLRVDLAASIKGHEGLLGARRSRNRGFLVGAQVAMSLVLLVAAGLFLLAQFTTFRASPGFETRQVLILSARTPMPPYTAGSAAVFYRDLERRLQTIPGVRSVAFASAPPFSSDEGGGPTEEIRLLGQAKSAGLKVFTSTVSAKFFATLDIPIVRGRGFVEGDVPRNGAISPIVVSEAFARTLWQARNPLGRIVQDSDGNALEIVGVARDVKSQRLGVMDGPFVYRVRDPRAYGDSVLMRFYGDAAPIQSAVHDLLREMDRDLLPRITTLQSSVDFYLDSFWKVLDMVLFLAGVALGLAIVGIHGVVAFSVSRRTREMGIRMALGATRRDIVVSVIASGVRPILLGLFLGTLVAISGAMALDQALRLTPFSIDVKNPVPYLAVALLLMTTALLAMLGPALRAAGSEPLSALRQE